MRNVHPQYTTDNSGRKLSVILSVKDYEKIVEELEELEDLKMYDAVNARNEKSIPFEDYLAKRKKRKNA